ncbi:ribosome small subunit-dependent GTPase A [Mycoplasmopsis agassizii]|uniref:ribosome small subunit-dependent GTPase A n=1 Tax=Mycoplasmopsis agassizii TaxID=33922 RepID=UPI003527B9F9
MQGKVYQILAGYYDIKSGDKIYRVRGAGKLRHNNLTPLVGDEVIFENEFLIKILERKNEMIRPKVANIDQVIIVMSLKEPDFSSFLLDKFLAKVYHLNSQITILLTKKDLYDGNNFKVDFYLKNQDTYLISMQNLEEYKGISNLFDNKVNVLMGQTGVGKTTFLNLISDNDFLTQKISKSLGRGIHSTRVVRMIDFLNGQLVDAPGFSSFEIDFDPLELARTFKFYKNFEYKCKFRTCQHYEEDEKICSVKQEISKKNIPLWRYENYVKILLEVRESKNKRNF